MHHRSTSSHRHMAIAMLAAVAIASPAGAQQATHAMASAPAAKNEVSIDEVRAATTKYRDLKVALADGYMPAPPGACVTAAMIGAPDSVGAMGIHYVRPDLLGIKTTQPRVAGDDGVIDWLKPEILMYEPQADGSMQLLGVEYLVFEAGWKAAGNTAEPSYQGNKFYRMEDNPATPMDEAHGFAPHYELHAWTERANPSGMFQEFNPAVSCKNHKPHTGHE